MFKKKSNKNWVKLVKMYPFFFKPINLFDKLQLISAEKIF